MIGCSPSRFRSTWHKALSALRFPTRFKCYGLRRGGATAHFRLHGSFSRTSHRGRWKHERTTRLYVQDAMLSLSEHFDTLAQSVISAQRVALIENALRHKFWGTPAPQDRRSGSFARGVWGGSLEADPLLHCCAYQSGDGLTAAVEGGRSVGTKPGGGPLLPLRGKAGRSFSGEPKRSAVAAVAGDYQFINMSVNTLSVHDKIRPRPI